ncbi:phage head closure protein [Limosilactobacillus reuteri]|uniref:phage head closure protein n=1 Tax=Limosilactobacillus reuteri TaxID=1598 RepID=UPI002F2607EC
MRLPISRLNHLIEFGVTDTVPTDTIEGSKEVFVPKQKLHCAFYQRSLTQQYQLLGTKLNGTIIVAVRSQYHVKDDQLARIDDGPTVYKIVNISRDDSHTPIRYDLITLQNIEKVGTAND